MDRISIALADTPGFFAFIIRRAIGLSYGLSYARVALSLVGQSEEAYSIKRENPLIPLEAGFERAAGFEREGMELLFEGDFKRLAAEAAPPLRRELLYES